MKRIFHVIKDRSDPEYREFWDVIDENGNGSLINRLSEIRQDGIVVHKGIISDKLPTHYSFLINSPNNWACYWFEK